MACRKAPKVQVAKPRWAELREMLILVNPAGICCVSLTALFLSARPAPGPWQRSALPQALLGCSLGWTWYPCLKQCKGKRERVGCELLGVILCWHQLMTLASDLFRCSFFATPSVVPVHMRVIPGNVVTASSLQVLPGCWALNPPLQPGKSSALWGWTAKSPVQGNIYWHTQGVFFPPNKRQHLIERLKNPFSLLKVLSCFSQKAGQNWRVLSEWREGDGCWFCAGGVGFVLCVWVCLCLHVHWRLWKGEKNTDFIIPCIYLLVLDISNLSAVFDHCRKCSEMPQPQDSPCSIPRI